MKRIIILAFAALFAAATTVSAQDMAAATETYNNGAMALSSGDNDSALNYFKEALSMAEACGEEGLDIVANCKNIIPSIVLSIGKEYARNDDYDNAVAKIKEAAAVAQEYGNAEVEAEAETLVPQLLTQKANGLLRAKDFAAAAEAFKDVLALEPENGRAYLMLGTALSSSGDADAAVEAFTKAAEYGEKEDADKQLSNLYLRIANSAYKAKNYQAAIDAVEKCISYKENGNAYKIAANSATKLSKNSDAITYYEKYLEASPNAKDAAGITLTVAVLYQQAGNKAKAIEYYEKIASDPQYGATAQEQLKALK